VVADKTRGYPRATARSTLGQGISKLFRRSEYLGNKVLRAARSYRGFRNEEKAKKEGQRNGWINRGKKQKDIKNEKERLSSVSECWGGETFVSGVTKKKGCRLSAG
jgi:hypothetical protein